MSGLAFVPQEGGLGALGVPSICISFLSAQTLTLTPCNDRPYQFVASWSL